MPDEFILKIIGDAGTRFTALKLLEADFIEYPIAPLGDWAMIEDWESHRVYTFPYPATHPLWIQQRNPVLSNRFVRLAMAHAIPYDWINTEVLDDWGVETPIRARTWILPTHDVFHPNLPPYEYNLDKARMYMNMWQYSRAGEDYTQAPLGDHDFNGLVEIPDYPLWVNNLGKAVGELPWFPSQPIDPDNDNNGLVELDDSWYWAPYIGKEYPFPDPR